MGALLVIRRHLLATVACVLVAGFAWSAATPPRPCGFSGQEPRVFQAVVTRPQTTVPGGRRLELSLDARIEGHQWRSARGALLVHETREDEALAPLIPGDVVRFRARLHDPVDRKNPGIASRRARLGSRGVHCVGSATAPGVIPTGDTRSGPWRWAALVRRRGEGALSRPTGDGARVAQALVTGDRGRIRPSIVDDFRRSGLAHLLALSGLHLASVAGMTYLAVRRGWRRVPAWSRRVAPEAAAAVSALVAAGLFTLATGAQVSTVRALLCAAALMLGCALGRRVHGPTAIILAALVIVALRPAVVHEAGFQLSFAAAGSLVAGARWLRLPAAFLAEHPARRICVTAIHGAALTSLVAQVGTLPVLAHHFGDVPLLAVVANLMAVPLTTVVVLPLSLAALVLGPWFPWLPMLAAAAADLLVRLAAWFADSPQLSLFPPGPAGVVFLAAFLVLLSTGRARVRLVAAAMMLASVIAWGPEKNRDSLEVTFVDVGQGDSTFIETPSGARWLFDAGGSLFGAPDQNASRDDLLAHRSSDPGERNVWPFLRHEGVAHLDLVVVSHAHPDHYGGLAAVARHVTIDEVWVATLHGDPRYEALLRSLANRGTVVRVPPRGLALRDASGAALWVHAPVMDDRIAPPPWWSVNDGSLVVELRHRGRRLVWLGDVEHEAEAELADLGRIDVAKVPHHGSPTSSTAALVHALSPSIAVISCGTDNLFGFPSPEVVQRWRSVGARVMRTDLEGAIRVTIASDGKMDAFPLTP